ncbi:MAG: hypothetical protein ABSB79_12065 [Syntrophales bacterium]|jgi:integrase
MTKIKQTKNPNHPTRGSSIVVDPIRNEKDIKAIRKLLSGITRDHLLFVMGINNGLRTGDLLKLKVIDVKNMQPGDSISIKEGKQESRISSLSIGPSIRYSSTILQKAT